MKPSDYRPAVENNPDAPLAKHFATLQGVNIAQIQHELGKWNTEFRTKGDATDEEMQHLDSLMHRYAIRDYDYMKHLDKLSADERILRMDDLESHLRPEGDPYNCLNYLRLQDDSMDELRRFLTTSLPRRLTYSKEERTSRRQDYADRSPPQHLSTFVDRLAQLILALIGGGSLIVPMLIMSIHASKTKSLITVSVATFIFSFLLSMALKLQNHDVIAATAAYAAVLVVFVGTST